MRYTKRFAGMALAAGMLIGAGTLSAADWRDGYRDRQDVRADYARAGEMDSHLARDQARLNEDIRCGRQDAAARDAADLARDQRAIGSQYREVQHDRWYTYGNGYRDHDRDWR